MRLSLWIMVVLLLAGVVVRHFTALSVGAHTYLGIYGWYYVVGGLWESLLCALLGGVLLATTDRWARLIGVYAMALGVIEGLQMAVCRVLVRDPMTIPWGVNACDHVTGLPITGAVMVLEIVVLLYFVKKTIANKSWS